MVKITMTGALEEEENLLKVPLSANSDSEDEKDSILRYSKIELKDTQLKHVTVDQDGRSHSLSGIFYVVMASVMASLGGILFGYDIGIISGAVLQLKDDFCLSCSFQEMVISSMLLGAVGGSLLGGFLIDKYGRRLTIILNAVVFLIGAVVLGLSPNYAALLVGRLILGFAVSVSATGECIYISEIAPPKKRGLLVSLNELGITLGLLLAYLVNFLFIDVQQGWRYMFGLSAVPAIIQGVGMFFLPQSPRYLMLVGKEKQAEEVLLTLRGSHKVKVSKELDIIKDSISSEKNHRCVELLSSDNNMRGRMFIGAGLVFFQQCTGQPNVLYYAPTIFEAIGFESNSAATLATVGLGCVKVVMTMITLCCVDKWGRRKFLLTGATLMGLALLTLGLISHLNDHVMGSNPCKESIHCHNISTNISSAKVSSTYLISNDSYTSSLVIQSDISANLSTTTGSFGLVNNFTTNMEFDDSANTVSTTIEPHIHLHGSTVGKMAAFTALMIFVAAFGFSFGPVSWLILSEIFPASIRGRAISFVTVLNWGTNLVVSFTFLDIIEHIGVSWTFVMFSIICAISVIFIFTAVPETREKSLEQISKELNKSSLIRFFKK